MIDNLLQFKDESEAIADPVAGAYHSKESGWRGDVCIPNQTATEISTGIAVPGFIVTISTPEIDPALSEHPNCMLCVDWDSNEFVHIAPQYNPTEYVISPIFAGRDVAALMAAQPPQ